MRKHFLLILLSILLICTTTMLFVGCNDTPDNTNEIGGGTTQTPSGDNSNDDNTSKFSLSTNLENCTVNGDKINITVPNSTNSFSFINSFDIPENYKWELHYDKSCLPSLNVVSKSVDLEEGNNVLYGLFINKNDANDIYLYEILVHRCHMVTISYYDGDTLLYTEATLSGQTFTPTYQPSFVGYDFDYWKTSNDEAFYNALILSSISVYAQKIPEEYTITYNINGGQSLSNNTQKVKYGEKYELIEPKKDGCTFLGWYRDSVKFENSVWLYEENITLTAKWICGDAFYQNGQLFVYFGKYPQTYVSDENIINALNNIYTFNEDGYRVYNGEEYAAMYNYSSYDEYPSFCYFKVEPILWRVVFEENNAYTLVSEYVLDNCYWGANETVSYYDSFIRKELNSTFYDSFFSEFEKSQILNTTVDNSANSTNGSYPNYSCNNSSDKMFLLSNLEVETYFTTASSRIAKATDYAKVNYVKTSSSDDAYWVTRSPYAGHSTTWDYSVSIYTAYGNLYWTMDNYTDSGVRPAIRVQG